MSSWVWRLLLAATFSAITSALLLVLSAPAPAMFAGFAAAAAFSLLANVQAPIPGAINRVSQAVLGGTVATLVDIDQWATVRAQLPVVLAATTLTILAGIGTGQFLRRRGTSATTAVLASVPGGASTVTAIAADLGADQRVVVVVQYLRVVVVIVTLPVLLAGVFDATAGSQLPTAAVTAESWLYVVAVVPGASSSGGYSGSPPPPSSARCLLERSSC